MRGLAHERKWTKSVVKRTAESEWRLVAVRMLPTHPMRSVSYILYTLCTCAVRFVYSTCQLLVCFRTA